MLNFSRIICLFTVDKIMLLLNRQCSECDNSNSNSEPEIVDPNAPRRLRYGARDQSLSDSQDNTMNEVCILI